ncbi:MULTISPECIES: phosphoribosyltransferase family protein [unclassified Bacillus (in: firmicutes)]|uniref:phosphoribosyltransferase family protein n=1 Tax=unclassified Bacillus (in: firmicutes) TaxID=185979 RepID=UPI0008F3B542|nr:MULTISPECIES: phosphoribosyltransferase family protein [unclassified Bacillus (in: firmicutes)]SFB25847.1 TRSP domain C terminus to PRTase_2 [Bacillus sp. UNCCL13]SFQ91854.1 TRSP domain C terminus to PRTase_2 [Bacillus sp. cl95]
MTNSQTLTSLRKKHSYQILDSLRVEVKISENPYNLQIDDLFTMAARINKRRSFLFVSKVLGKHLPIVPAKGLLTAALLGARYLEVVKNEVTSGKKSLIELFNENKLDYKPKAFVGSEYNPVVIGFAETATALGHSFFDCFKKGDFFHTTREQLPLQEAVITFEEEHSHATSHRCYVPESLINNNREIILVDDEVTTGKTALNIIRSIHSQFPRSQYTLVSILDWRSLEDRNQFVLLEKELGIEVHCVSLISGDFKIEETSFHEEEKNENSNPTSFKLVPETVYLEKELPDLYENINTPNVTLDGVQKDVSYLKETGRFGLDSNENVFLHEKIFTSGKLLRKKRTGNKTLCLGTGEFMYLPMRIAAEMGSGTFYQSTTRSPVYIKDKVDYGARYGLSFPNPEDHLVPHFVYNIPPNGYDEIFLFFEREVSNEDIQPLLTHLATLKISNVKVVFFTGKDRSGGYE